MIGKSIKKFQFNQNGEVVEPKEKNASSKRKAN